MNFFDKIITTYDEKNISLSGMTDEFFCVYLSKYFKEKKENVVVLTSTLYEANKLYMSLKNYCESVLLFPMDDFLTSESIAISPELKTNRLDTINRIISGKSNNILITHLDSFLRFLPTKSTYINSFININNGSTYQRDKLIEKLINIGYKRESIVTNTGEFGVRGYVIDIFPINTDYPVRIEFFDDEIESIRYFDNTSQKSIEQIDSISISPNTEFLLDDYNNFDDECFQKYLPKYSREYINICGFLDKYTIIIKDYSQILSSYKKEILDIEEYKNFKDQKFDGKYMFSLDNFDLNNCIYYNTVENLSSIVTKNYDFSVKKVPIFNENIDIINDYIDSMFLKNYTVIISLRDYQTKAFLKYLKRKYVLTDEFNIYENILNIINYPMSEGFIYGKYVFITQKELFNKTYENKYKSRFKYSSKIKSISNLEKGDYVVHSVNGVGIYNGIKSLSKNDVVKDYLEILYSGSDKLYIPVEKIQLIGKYTGKEGYAPKINKLGSSEWQKTKLRVRNRVKTIAKDLLNIYAKRKMDKGFAFSKDNELQSMFESEFEFEETPDQLRAINQIKSDMENIFPMDRLLCGDVGYGKTEVAFRAMFKAVNDSKQVLYLCPTTILSSQQYNNAIKRFSNFPVRIELLNRFTSSKKTKEILRDLEDGKIDILFGTHRILGNDIKPKDLGLLIVDEEQRFGVVHKEKIKQYKENIDVLTLTATPIPRTLQMSLVGLRSLSLIETPPVDRYPIQTYVIEENKALIKDAIYKEMARGGQVFILYNNVKNIENKVFEIQQLVPDARIVFTHGQLNKSELEEKMIDFINYKYDIMVCTTIIETGIDINNANTLIIYNADYFGLSQLYQIRGRVGRSNKIAYAYLMYKKDKMLSETALKRLQAIKEFTELGSGFSIASRDLSIRGAGDILGSEQAGFIDSVGIDMYLKILNEEVERLKGNVVEEDSDNVNNILDVDTHISDEYVEDEDLKIEIHKLINSIKCFEDIDKIKTEIEDRFGKIDDKLYIYMYEEWFEELALKYELTKVRQNSSLIEFSFSKDISNKINGESLFVEGIKLTTNFKFSYKNEILSVSLYIKDLDKHYIYYLTSLFSNIKFK